MSRPSVTSADGSAPPDGNKDEVNKDLLDPTANIPRKPRLLLILLLPG